MADNLHSLRACTCAARAMTEAQILSVILLSGVMLYLVFTTR